MRRVFHVFGLIVLAAYLTGCGAESSVNDSTPPSQETANAAAAKMPPPPGTNVGGKVKPNSK